MPSMNKGMVWVRLYPFSTVALEKGWVGWVVSAKHRRLFCRKTRSVTHFTGSCARTGPSWMGLENLCLPGFKSRTLQPLVSRALRYFRVSFHQCSILIRGIAFIFHRHFIILYMYNHVTYILLHATDYTILGRTCLCCLGKQ